MSVNSGQTTPAYDYEYWSVFSFQSPMSIRRLKGEHSFCMGCNVWTVMASSVCTSQDWESDIFGERFHVLLQDKSRHFWWSTQHSGSTQRISVWIHAHTTYLRAYSVNIGVIAYIADKKLILHHGFTGTCEICESLVVLTHIPVLATNPRWMHHDIQFTLKPFRGLVSETSYFTSHKIIIVDEPRGTIIDPH